MNKLINYFKISKNSLALFLIFLMIYSFTIIFVETITNILLALPYNDLYNELAFICGSVVSIVITVIISTKLKVYQ